ncbi:hypothetical protein K438DRAFT_251862 [Mycena galopus ATCC 62051]|nr:hypothetical protein K438DRAFT_251862 [Mycena galopus ATCC 62051]
MSSPRANRKSASRARIGVDSTRSSERTAVVVERLGFGGGRVTETKRLTPPSTPRSELTVERLGFGGGRVIETKRSEPCLRRKATVSSLSLSIAKRREPRRDSDDPDSSGKSDGETTPKRLDIYHAALEKERVAVEMQIIALANAMADLEVERIAIDRRRVEVDEEQARMNRLIGSTRRNLRRINDQLERGILASRVFFVQYNHRPHTELDIIKI